MKIKTTQNFFFSFLHTQTTHARKYIFVRAYIENLKPCAVLIVSLYNEERRLGDQRGSDTLVVPFVTSNDGLSIALTIK